MFRFKPPFSSGIFQHAMFDYQRVSPLYLVKSGIWMDMGCGVWFIVGTKKTFCTLDSILILMHFLVYMVSIITGYSNVLLWLFKHIAAWLCPIGLLAYWLLIPNIYPILLFEPVKTLFSCTIPYLLFTDEHLIKSMAQLGQPQFLMAKFVHPHWSKCTS